MNITFKIDCINYIVFMENVTTNQIYKKEITIWLISLTILVQIMIIIGGLTRLTESGLSMVDWRPIMGTIPPLTEESWNIDFISCEPY